MKATTKVVEEKPIPARWSPHEPCQVRLFEGLTKHEINEILARAASRGYSTNSVVMNQGDPADCFFLLTKGCARLFFLTQEGQKVILRWLPPGEILGGAALLSNPASYIVSTEMLKDSFAFVWSRHSIRELATRYPRLLENALPFAMDHLTWFLASHMALISNTAQERLAQVVISLSRGIGRRTPGGIQLDVTNEQLANTANMTLFTVSRLLNQWRRKGAVVKRRGGLILCAPEKLFSHHL